MPKYREFTPARWIEIKTLWRTGKFATLLDLHRFVTQNTGMKVPCIKSIREKMSREGDWDKQLVQIEGEKAATDRAIEFLAKQGMPVESVLSDVVAAITACRRHIVALQKVMAKIADPAAQLVYMEQIDEVMRGLGMWLDQYKSFTGSAAPIKKIIPIDMESKWMVAQTKEANQAYEARLAEIVAEKAARNQALAEGEHAGEE